MRMHATFVFMTTVATFVTAGRTATADDAKPAAEMPAAKAFERLKSLKGSWIDRTGTFGEKGTVTVTYEVIANGSAVIERLFAGQPHEMMSVYHLDGSDLVMTHYCAARNQPRMKAGKIADDRIDFDFVGGTNLDPARDAHMHNGFIAWEGPDRLKGTWYGWSGGKPSDHAVTFELDKKK